MKPALFQTKSALLALLASVLAMSTVVLGGAPLVVMRRAAGRHSYFFWGAVCAGALYALGGVADAAVFGTLALLIGFYVELEEHTSILLSATVAILLSAGFAVSAFWLWANHSGLSTQVLLDARVDQMIKDLGELSQTVPLDKKTILAQLPSGLLILLSVTMWLSLILERRLSGFYLPATRLQAARPLNSFRVPDECIWVLIVSTAGTFIDFHSPVAKVVASNVFNVTVMIYFFQGLSVTDFFFEKVKMGRGWRALTYAFLIAYLFFGVSLLGVMDYWFNFRTRQVNKTPTVA